MISEKQMQSSIKEEVDAEQEYEAPSSQPYQNKILVYECNGQIGNRMVEYFRNDHLIELNPNIIRGTIDPNIRFGNHLNLQDIIDQLNHQQALNFAIQQSDIIIYPLTTTNSKHLDHLLKFIKSMKLAHPKKIIVISSLITWSGRTSNASTNILKNEDLQRRNSINYAMKTLQNLCLALNQLNNQAKGYVIGCGIIYGMGENVLFEHFKKALEQEQKLKIVGAGTNYIPTVHVDDVCQIAYEIAFHQKQPEKGFIFGVDHSQITQQELVLTISKTLGNGGVNHVPIQNGFLEQNFDMLAMDIQIEKKSLPEISTWKCKNGFSENIGKIVSEFNSYRGLKPNKIFIHGPPVSGKSKIAEILSKNYGLVVLDIKKIIEEVKNQDNDFANGIKGILEELKAIKIEEERKIYEEAKKKKKGKGVDDFDPTKVIPRLPDAEIVKILKRRLQMSDCLNKGYIIDGILKSYSQIEAVFTKDGSIDAATFPNSVFSIEATEEEIKDRVKKLPVEIADGTHWNEDQSVRRFAIYNKQNEDKKWYAFFQAKVDIKNVSFTYENPSQLTEFIERNGPLGFKKKIVEVEQSQDLLDKNKEPELQNQQNKQIDDEDDENQMQEEFNLQKLTENETKILNEKSRPIRQYLIDNVIPQITEGLLQICKETPRDPIDYLIKFLEVKKTKKRK